MLTWGLAGWLAILAHVVFLDWPSDSLESTDPFKSEQKYLSGVFLKGFCYLKAYPSFALLVLHFLRLSRAWPVCTYFDVPCNIRRTSSGRPIDCPKCCSPRCCESNWKMTVDPRRLLVWKMLLMGRTCLWKRLIIYSTKTISLGSFLSSLKRMKMLFMVLLSL